MVSTSCDGGKRVPRGVGRKKRRSDGGGSCYGVWIWWSMVAAGVDGVAVLVVVEARETMWWGEFAENLAGDGVRAEKGKKREGSG
ncbi:hypothetical protein Tco_0770340 [Tanacetum coccineum]|uniref:Uncharacterized protein n=1 Tax=Tanacetum coccineum TaxID=301880 RepID=A0ABQ4ZBY3_9ASTR